LTEVMSAADASRENGKVFSGRGRFKMRWLYQQAGATRERTGGESVTLPYILQGRGKKRGECAPDPAFKVSRLTARCGEAEEEGGRENSEQSILNSVKEEKGKSGGKKD